MASQKEIQIDTFTRWDQTIAKIALANHMVNRDQLADAFAVVQKEKLSGRKAPIEAIFLKKNMISQDLLNELCVAAKRKLGKRYGLIALKKKYITQTQFDAALAQQAKEFKENKSCRQIGDILFSQGALTEKQRDEIQSGEEAVEMPPGSSNHSPGSEGSVLSEEAKNAADDAGDSLPEAEAETDDAAPPQVQPLELRVSENQLEAVIQIKGPVPDTLSLDDIKSFLEQEGIQYGVVDDAQIAAHLSEGALSKGDVVIARGKAMVPGRDAAITYHFDKDYLSAGRIQEDGDIDYRDRGEIPRVQKDGLIAEKIPAAAGEGGMDVYGRSIPVPEPDDLKLNCESGTWISEDGLKVFAKIDGQPNVTVAGIISVFAEFNVQGDVNYETGNIDFDGNINVNGSVNDGFSVKGGNLTAKEILGARIHVKGDVIVSGGIMGTLIEAEGTVTAKYIKNSNIKAYGNVIVTREVLDSKVRVSGKFINQSGKIISSLICAKQGVEAKDIGTDVSIPCTIKVGVDDHIRKIVQGFENTASEIRQDLEKKQFDYEGLLASQKGIHKKIADLIQIQERAAGAEQKLKRKFAALKAGDDQEETVKAENLIMELKKKTAANDKNMATCFKSQETLSRRIEESLSEIEEMICHIEDLNKQKQAVIDWSKEEKGTPILQATGSIFSNTKIHGERSLFHTPDTIQNVTLKEFKPPEPNASYEMTIVDD